MNSNHPEESARLTELHSQALDPLERRGDQLITMQDASYDLGRQRGWMEERHAILSQLVRILRDDGHAAGFQTLGQYRASLIESINKHLPSA